MSTLKETLARKIEEHRPRTVRLLKEYGDVKLSDVTIAQAIGGARGVRCLVTDTSYLDPMEGIRFRGKTIPETFEALPKYPGSDYPTVEAFWWFILTGDVPTEEQTNEVIADFKERRKVPQYVFDVLRAMPRDTHPMTMFSAAILSMQRESIFGKKYREGISKMEYWDPTYEDACELLAKLPVIGAYIYRLKFKDDTPIDLYQIEILHRLQTEGPMTFERIFESRASRVVMIGLFLAMLELIREKLIWAEQSADSKIYVRPLTDEPAERAVQKAILATEADYDERPEGVPPSNRGLEARDTQPPIPIAELPAKSAVPVETDTQQPQEQPAIPITELPADSGPVISPRGREKQEAGYPEEPERQPAN